MADITKQQLEELYVNQGLSARECAEKLGLPTHGGIAWRLKKFSIKTRPNKFQAGNQVNKGRCADKHPQWKGGKSLVCCDVCGRPLLKFPSHIGEHNFCGHVCAGKWRAENFKGSDNPNHGNIVMFGEANPNWKGGISFQEYCDVWKDVVYKKDIRDRDGYVCQNPECRGNTKRLSIHHINYDKKDCRPQNLITLCISCNARANFNRDFWEAGYKEIIRLKYEAVNQQIAV